ncbi:MAG: competence/damage-inducible protein A [Candidatus Solibacter sp.]
MNAEIIAIGSEMLCGERVDTNSLYLTAELNRLGIEVVTKCVIGDDRDRLAAQVRESVRRSGIVILSGGLGPTEDDVTRDAVAVALDRKLAFDREIGEWLEQRFAAAKRKMAEVNKRQAFVIQGAQVLANDRGTAPGQWLEESGAVCILLPGPPHELRAMFERHCLPRIARIAPKQVIRTLFLRVAGMGESDLDQLIAPVYRNYENPVTTILAAAGDIQIHLRARCETEAEAEGLLAEVGGPIELLLGDRIYSRNGDPLHTVVGELLHRMAATVSVAESATGGMLGERLTSSPGSSAYFVGGVIAYSNEMKVELLGVLPETLAQFGAASKETAEAMAMGARRRTRSTYALSITGAAGPEAGDQNVPKGTMFVGLADAAGVISVQRQYLGDRQRIRAFTAQLALDVLRRRITGLL